MPKTAVIDDRSQFIAFLSAQPLCQWCARKEQDIASGKLDLSAASTVHAPKPKNDNADLAAALSSMA